MDPGDIPTTFSSVHTLGGIGSSITIDLMCGSPQLVSELVYSKMTMD